MSSESVPAPLGRIITFYSYKGGTGRSMALANIAWLLASAGRRVLVIDWDLEAPGLHRYFAPFLIDEEVTGSEGLIDLVDAYSNEAIQPVATGTTMDPDWFVPYTDISKLVVTVNFRHFATGGKIDFLPAGRQGDHYALAVSSFNWQNFYDRLGGGGFFEAIKQRLRQKYDYVLIDSRTGVSDTAGICSVQMPDSLVVCFTYNNQSIKGAAAVARSAKATHQKLVEEQLALLRSGKQSRFAPSLEDLNRKYRVFPVPMRVDDGESDRLAVRQAYARATFSGLVDHIRPDMLPDYWQQVQVPYRVFYAYEEVLAPFKDDPRDPNSVLQAQLRLMRYITDGDVTDFRLLISAEDKRRLLDAYAATPTDKTAPSAPAQAAPESPKETEEQILARKADVAMAELPQLKRPIARRVLLRLVRISPEEEGAGYFPIRSRLGELREDEREVAEILARHGLLTIGAETPRGEPSVGMDARLLKAWPTLTGWLDEDHDFLAWRQELRASLAAWLRSGRDNGSLLSGRSLNEADLILLRRRDDLSDAEIDYIEQSRRTASGTPSVPRSDGVAPEMRAAAAPAAPVAPAPPGSSRLRWPALLTLAVLLVAGGLWWWSHPAHLPSESRIAVPKLEGLTSEQARTLATESRLEVVMNDGKSGNQPFIAGVVVTSQSPAAGVLTSPLDPIVLTVAAATVSVPQLAGEEITSALKLLDAAYLKPGKTDYRHVPNAPLGRIASQKPDAGALVVPGTAIDMTVARAPQLSEVQIGIYYLAGQDEKLAANIHKYLLGRGMQPNLRARDVDFLTKRGVAPRNQIRYSRGSESSLKDDLTKVLKEGRFGDFEPRPTRDVTDGFISIFLAAYPSAAKRSAGSTAP